MRTRGELICLTIEAGSMPCSRLYASWIFRRRRGLLDRPAHRVGHGVGVEEDAPVEVAGGAARRLDERGLAAQETLLVGVEDRHDGDLRQVEPLAQEVDPDQAVEDAAAEVREDRRRGRASRCRSGGSGSARRPPRSSSSAPPPSAWSASSRGRARPSPAASRTTPSRSSTWPLTGRTSIDRVEETGRPDHLLDDSRRRSCASSSAAGVALT